MFFTQFAIAGWTNLNTGIVDNLNDVYFWGANGVLAGDKGIYYTTSGGNGSASWTRFNITNNLGDAAIYNATQFYDLGAPINTNNEAFFCGKDTIGNRAVIFKLNIVTLSYSIFYLGPTGSKLNSLAINNIGILYAVGDNGLIIKSDLSSCSLVNSAVTQNLNSVKINTGVIVISGNGVILNCTDSGTLNITVYAQSSINIKSAYPSSSNTIYGVGTDVYKFSFSGAIYNILYAYDSGPMNGNDITFCNNNYYIATDHGIYKANSTVNYAEYQLTSGTSTINKIWFTGTPTGFATGNNGLLLKTTDWGGPVKPYATMNPTIKCNGEASLFSGDKGSATNCNWLLDGVSVSNSCGNFFNTISVLGTHTLTFIVWNADAIYDTVNRTIHSVASPHINLHTTLSDSILCEKQSVLIGIDSSQNDFIYQLKRYSLTNNLGSVAGTGVSINLVSDSLQVGGAYYINVQSTLSECAKAFTDTLKIGVEHTKADFHSSMINAAINENVSFYETTTEAQNFIWNFPNGTNAAQSFVADPNGITFNNLGQTIIQLICWSNAGCYDTITKPGPFVYNEPLPEDTSWALAVDGIDPGYVNGYVPGILSASMTRDGYLLAGRTYKDILTSRYGNEYGRTGIRSGCLLKYSKNGALKWHVLFKEDLNYNFMAEPLISSVYSDPQQNIFITGNGITKSYLYTNDGDSVRIMYQPPFNYNIASSGFMAKLDSTGVLMWSKDMRNVVPEHIKTDHEGNIFITGHFGGAGFAYLSNSNGSDTTFIPNVVAFNYFLLKLDSAGNVLWNARINLDHNNSAKIADFDFDQNNNIYLTGEYEHTSYFFSANSSAQVVYTSPTDFYGTRLFVVKYDSLGNVHWGVKGLTINFGNQEARVGSIASDSAGNTYISGSTRIFGVGNYSQGSFEVTDASGAISDFNIGAYFLMKLSPNGLIKWVTGSERVYTFSWSPAFLCLHKNVISVVSTMGGDSWSPWVGNLLSTDNNSIPILNYNGDNFIADYDTSGVLLRVNMTGINNITSGSRPISILRDNHDMYYIVGHSLHSNNPTFSFFNDQVMTNGTYESFVGKMGINGWTPICVNPFEVTQHLAFCSETSLIVGSNSYSSSGTYHDTLISFQGCDSIVTTNLTVSLVDTSVSVLNSTTLRATAFPATYQWVNCNNGNTSIAGQTNQIFTPTTNGSYAVIVTKNNCSDTSFCYDVNTIGISENDFSSALKIYPNPFSFQTNIIFTHEQKDITIKIMDVLGKEIKTISFTGKQLIIDKKDMQAGIYFIEIQIEQRRIINKLIIQ